MSNAILRLACVAAFTAFLPAAANAAVTLNCATGATRVVTAPGGILQASATFAGLPGMKTAINQGGVRNGCVIVYFSAEMASGNVINVRVLLDNVAANPTAAAMFGSMGTAIAESRSFVFGGIKPGSHQLAIQYSTPGVAVITSMHMIVNYAP